MAKTKRPKQKLPLANQYTNKGYTIKFGKYRGQLIQTVPRDYIEWAVTEISDAELRLKFRSELAWRDWVGPKKHKSLVVDK
jgi:hypothetical protein